MAPRTAKAKKTTETSEATKKGRSKVKDIAIVLELEEQDLDNKLIVEKKKRGKKAAPDSTNGTESNGKDETAPPAKRGKRKVEESPMEEDIESIDNNSAESSAGSNNADNESVDTNGDMSVKAPSSQGRKKQPKKAEPKGKGKKAKPEVEASEAVEEKPAGRGRGKKVAAKSEDIIGNIEEPVKVKAGKGRKKPAAKATEKVVDSDEAEDQNEEEKDFDDVKKDVEEIKKKETKAKKGKKEVKADSEEKDDEADEVPAKKKKVTKKEVKGKGDTKEEDDEVEIAEAKPKARGRGKKADDKAPEPKRKAPAKNKAATDYQALDFSNESKNTQNKDWNFKISSWNVAGIRSWMEKGGLDYATHEKPDILCLQEIKCAEDKLPEELTNLAGYHGYWSSGGRDGHSGVNVYTTQLAINVQKGLNNEDLDEEGRIITSEYEQFYLICVYVPNSGRKLVTLPKRLEWNKEFRKHVKELDKKKPVIICGDMNVSHKEIDLANPKTNRKHAGFTDEERAGMTELLGDGFVDTFRHLYPDKTAAYTFWTYMMNCRAKNVGWRLDYFIISERLLPALCDNVIRDQVFGSDHCPIALFLHLPGADKPKESL